MGEAIKKVKDNLNEFWQGLDKGKKIRIVVLSVTSILLISIMGIFLSLPKYEPLYLNLDAKSAGEIKNKLEEMKIPVKVDGTNILVPKDKIDEARINLAMEGLPSDDYVLPEMLKSSFNETSQDKRLKERIYLQNSIANGIKSLDGVEWAKVNLFIPDDDIFVLESNKQESSASVIVKTKAGHPGLDEEQINGIIQYISKSVKGLKESNISIIDESGRSLKSESTGFNAKVSTQMELQEATRLSIQNSVKKFLGSVFGLNNVDVMATVKLNFNNEVENQTIFEPVNEEGNSGIIRSMEEIKKQWVNTGNGGVPGTDTNIDITTYPQADETTSSYNEASSVVNYEINETQKQIVKEQGNIESFSISVLINEDALKDENSNNVEVEDLVEDVKELVKFATQGLVLNSSAADENIHVQVMKFDTTYKDEYEQEMAKLDKQKRNENLLKLGSAVAAIIILAGAMIMLVRRSKKEEMEDDIDAALRKIEETSELNDIDFEDKNEVKKKIEKFISQKPEQVAQLLKTWLNEE